MYKTILAVPALSLGLTLSAAADERAFTNATVECGFVVVNGQPLEQRFPNAQPLDGYPHIHEESRGTVEIRIDTAQNSCSITDTSVSIDAGTALLPDIIHSMRLMDPEDTFFGRGEKAIRGDFVTAEGKQPVYVVYAQGGVGGTQFKIIPE